LYAILASSVLVLFWGLPSHFGYDPTCLLFRGTLDVSCWTAQFLPKVRIFSTLGQPDWAGGIPGRFNADYRRFSHQFINQSEANFNKSLTFLKEKTFGFLAALLVVFMLSYLALLYTRSRAAILSVWIVIPLLLVWYFWFYLRPKLEF